MGCSSSMPVQNDRINMRLLMNPADSNDKRQPQQIHQSFSHIRQISIGTLEQACQTLQIKDLSNCIKKAKIYSQYPKAGLEQDEQAAINLYTQQNQFYMELNDVLRKNDERSLMPWYGYLKLFLTALDKLPPYKGTVWRGVPKNLSAEYKKDSTHVWWAFSSCTSSVAVLQSPNFLGATGARTLFNIEVFNGRLISEFSEYAPEDEILLLPGTHIRVVSVLEQPTGLNIIHVKQITPSYSLFGLSQSQVEPYHPKSQAETYHPESHHPQHINSIDEAYSQGYTPVQEHALVDEYVTGGEYAPDEQQHESDDPYAPDEQQHESDDPYAPDEQRHESDDPYAPDEQRYESDDPYAPDEQRHESDDPYAPDKEQSEPSTTLTADFISAFNTQIELSKSIGADSDKAKVFKHLLTNKNLTDQMMASLVDCVKTMYSSSDKAEVLQLIAKRSNLSSQQFRVSVAAVNGMKEDYDKTTTMNVFLAHEQYTVQHLDVVLSATAAIFYYENKAAIFLQLICNRYLDAQHFPLILHGIKEISDSENKSKVLCTLAPRLPKSDVNVQKAYLAAASSIKESADKAAATIAFTFGSGSKDDQQQKGLFSNASNGKLTEDELLTFNTQIELSKSISYDADKTNVFKHLLTNKNLTDQMMASLVDCAKTMYSSSDKAEVLQLIAKRSNLSSQQFRVSVAAVNGMKEDDDKTTTMNVFLAHEQYTVQHLDVVLSATAAIFYYENKAAIFLQLICNRYLDAQHFPLILHGIKEISDSENKSKVLCTLAPRLPKSDVNVQKAYLAAASSIKESADKTAATIAFTFGSGSKDDELLTFNTQIELSKSISYDSDKVKVLQHLLTNKNLTDQMMASLVDCAKTMYSSSDKAEVLQLIAKRSNLSSQQFRVSVAAVNGMKEDYDKTTTMNVFLAHEQYTVQHLDVVLSATAAIFYYENKAAIFLQLICNCYLDAQHFPLILHGIKEISDSENKSKVLCTLAPRLPKSDVNVQKAYLAAAGSIKGSEEKAAATMAFI